MAARVGGRTGVSRIIDWWNGDRGAVILAYHEISPARLESQLDRLSRSYRFVSLTELDERLARGESGSGMAAVTFDDGYGPTIEAAAELARLRGWPMSFYLPTRYLDTGEPYWYQELDALIEAGLGRRLVVDGLDLRLSDPDAAARAKAFLTARFKSLSTYEEVEELLRQARLALCGDQSRPARLAFAPPISWSRVRELSAHAEISFETHSVHHLALSRLSEPALRRELENSRARIEAETGRPSLHFCYPYGEPDDIGELGARAARSLFRTATTMVRGRCRPGLDRALLPRVPLYEKDDELTAELKVALAA